MKGSKASRKKFIEKYGRRKGIQLYKESKRAVKAYVSGLDRPAV